VEEQGIILELDRRLQGKKTGEASGQQQKMETTGIPPAWWRFSGLPNVPTIFFHFLFLGQPTSRLFFTKQPILILDLVSVIPIPDQK